MRVLHISSASETDGAGKACLLTHKALKAKGIDSNILFLKTRINDKSIFSFHSFNKVTRLKRFLFTHLDQLILLFYPFRNKKVLFSPGKFGHKLSKISLIKKYDILHVHWPCHGFIDLLDLKNIKVPIIWTMRDMWTFTGGCHYAIDCKKFIRGCGNCPQLGSNSSNDISRTSNHVKRHAFNDHNIILTTISSWMKKEALKSNILKSKKIAVIPSSIDPNEFMFLSQEKSKLKLNIPPTRKLIVLGAGNIKDKYKGYEYTLELLKNLEKDKFIIATFGNGAIEPNDIDLDVMNFGYQDAKFINLLFSAGDIFISSSISEALGKTNIESQFSGCPVLAFEGTGAADIIVHKETGYLAKHSNHRDFLNGFNFILDSNLDRENISISTQRKFDIYNTIESYIQIYEKNYLDGSHCSRPQSI